MGHHFRESYILSSQVLRVNADQSVSTASLHDDLHHWSFHHRLLQHHRWNDDGVRCCQRCWASRCVSAPPALILLALFPPDVPSISCVYPQACSPLTRRVLLRLSSSLHYASSLEEGKSIFRRLPDSRFASSSSLLERMVSRHASTVSIQTNH